MSMARGGARNRSGPAPDPTSGRSERRGITFDALPAAGYDGPVPAWPLSPRQVLRDEYDGATKVTHKVVDVEQSELVAARESAIWEWAWRTPQAWAWAQPSEAWRLHTVAMWVRTFVLCESSDATAADKNSLHRFADQVGLTPAGLRENGWVIAKDELSARRAGEAGDRPVVRRERRLREA